MASLDVGGEDYSWAGLGEGQALSAFVVEVFGLKFGSKSCEKFGVDLR